MVCRQFQETADEILQNLNVHTPTDFYEALEVYFILSVVFE